MTPTGGRRPVGRSPIGRGVFAIEDQELPLPDPIALDTSFVVEALIATQPLHGVCDPFLTRIFNSGISIVTSELLRVELAEAAFAIALKERWGGKWRGHRTDGRSRPRAGRLLNHTLIRYDEMLRSMTHISIPLGDTANIAPTFMTDYGIASYDAAHAATALAAGTETIVTTDTGFALLPASLLTVYTDSSRVPSCRKKRPR
jgi:predicted nucleic acid-binding protein